MYIVTGGAGFIGSNIAAALDEADKDIVIVDHLAQSGKWRNIAKRRLFDLVSPDNLADFLLCAKDVEAVIHMGAISTTTETDGDAIVRNNFRLSVDLWNFCAKHSVPLVYASSAATYGDGSCGFVDTFEGDFLARLRPLNLYGWSKLAFDRYVHQAVSRRRPTPPRWCGLKFFNVYGPNEYHKQGQRSVAHQIFQQVEAGKRPQLFRSGRVDVPDGGQLRDFVWVGDCVDVVLWALNNEEGVSGLFNVGSGMARPFRDVATLILRKMERGPEIDFIEMPATISGQYQYYTCADLTGLKAAGFSRPTTDLETGISKYLDVLMSSDAYI